MEIVAKAQAKASLLLQQLGVSLVCPRPDPSLDVADIYSALNYYVMISDRQRMAAYQAGLGPFVAGKNCLEIGVGAHLPLMQMALAGDALHIHGVEVSPSALQRAREVSATFRKDWQARITLHGCLSTKLELESRADCLYHEIVGTVASDEGMIHCILDAQERLLSPGARIAPEIVETLLVPVEEPPIGLASSVVSRVAMGCPRLATDPGVQRLLNPSRSCWLSSAQTVERFDFRAGAPSLRDQARQEHEVVYQTSRDGSFSGFLASCRVEVGDGAKAIDAMHTRTNWGTYFIRMVEKPLRLPKGSKLTTRFCVDARPLEPSYSLFVELPSGQTADLRWGGIAA